MASESPDLGTATAHLAWDERWRTSTGRAPWLEPDPDVVAALPLLHARGVRRVLDLGCGVGRHSLALAAAGFEVHGLDASEGGLDHTREAARQAGVAVDLRQGLMTDLPYAEASFDHVLAFNVIYHGDPAVVARAIAEIRRVLRPGGLYQGTMLSKRNVNFGQGTEIAPDTYVRAGEDDKDHPHFYCSAREALALFDGFEVLALVDREHRQAGAWHWHLLAEHGPPAGPAAPPPP